LDVVWSCGVVTLAAFASSASPCVGALSWAVVGMDTEGRACVAWCDGVGLEGVMAYRALAREGDELTYRGGCGAIEREVVVELELDVPLCEAFRGPFYYVMGLAVFLMIEYRHNPILCAPSLSVVTSSLYFLYLTWLMCLHRVAIVFLVFKVGYFYP
jgi:hypothetical protein